MVLADLERALEIIVMFAFVVVSLFEIANGSNWLHSRVSGEGQDGGRQRSIRVSLSCTKNRAAFLIIPCSCFWAPRLG